MNKERSVKETFLRIIACVVVFGFGGVCPQRGSNEPNNKLHNIHAHFYEGGCVNAIIHQCIHDFAHLLGMCVCVCIQQVTIHGIPHQLTRRLKG